MLRLAGFVIACAALAGCKSSDSAASGSAAATSDPTANATAKGGRSGKIDLGGPRIGSSEAAPDGTTTPAEERRRARLAVLDTDGDGQVSPEERHAARRKRAEDLRVRYDANGDGKLTPEEVAASAFRRLKPGEVDANGDGDVSVDELATALEQRSQAWGAERIRDRLRPPGTGRRRPDPTTPPTP